jgi:hypothetical protein
MRSICCALAASSHAAAAPPTSVMNSPIHGFPSLGREPYPTTPLPITLPCSAANLVVE